MSDLKKNKFLDQLVKVTTEIQTIKITNQNNQKHSYLKLPLPHHWKCQNKLPNININPFEKYNSIILIKRNIINFF